MSGRTAVRESLYLTKDQIEEMTKLFKTIDVNGSGYIDANELKTALEAVGIKLSGFEVRELVDKNDTKVRDGKMDIEEFKDLYTELKVKYDMKDKWQKIIQAPKGTMQVGSQAHDEIRHTIGNEEQVAFSNWINGNFSSDPDCVQYLPLSPETDDLYRKSSDGILFCKMINFAQSGTIDEKALNKGKLSVYQILENQTLACRSAQSIGCNVVNIGPEDLRDGKEHLVLGLMWQIIRIGLLSEINLQHNPNLVALLLEGETLEDFLKLSPEEILIRWVNYHLARSGCGRAIKNFNTDIKDSIPYIHLLHQIAPKDSGVSTAPQREQNLESRAEQMLKEADKIKCRAFVSPKDVVKGNTKLNLAFVANLFNKYPALEAAEVDLGDINETREEKTYRNWMNSMGVNPYVNRLYSDLTDGLIIFQLYDIIKPGCVDWKKVNRTFKEKSAVMERIENCNYAVLLGKQCNFSLVGISGKDLYDGNKTLTLALVWQLMRAYTLSILQKLTGEQNTGKIDQEIVAWANSKIQNAGKSGRLSGFNDPGISDGKIVLDLVDAITPGSVNYSFVKSGKSEEEKLENAKYGLTVARKTGARIYALPEDIVEVKSKMVMTIFACLMIVDLQNNNSN